MNPGAPQKTHLHQELEVVRRHKKIHQKKKLRQGKKE